MPVPSFLLGRNAKAYYNAMSRLIGDVAPATTPSEAVQSWLNDADTAIAGNLTDVGLNMNSETADATTRGTAEGGFSSTVSVLKNGEVTFEARWLPDDPNATADSFTRILLNAWQTDSTIAVVFLDQSRANPGAGNSIRPQGLASNWSVSMEKMENLRDIQRMSVTLTIADSGLWYAETIVGS